MCHSDDLHQRFLSLYTDNESSIRAYVRRLVPSRIDAADVMQDIALALWKKFGTFATDGNSLQFKYWGFEVARFEVLRWLRKRSTDRHILSDEIIQAISIESFNLDHYLTSQRNALAECLKKLPKSDRQLVLSAYSRDDQIKEIATRSGRTIAAFYQWLHRIRLKLVECTRRSLAQDLFS